MRQERTRYLLVADGADKCLTASWAARCAFSKLAPTQREALLLAVLEGLPYEVIAEHTGVSVGTVKSRVSRGRDRLEQLLLEGDAAPLPTTGIDKTAARNPRP